ncbi:family 1 glycosylhydrolase [Caulobacter sp. S45]|uniref:family 1 glycosylhydrolase n=1 Tax=Caulobacter sp. S45 TaxID=1641861 RepID=UPI00131DABDB|nr:family 1 glycosylhydrolase [Caulobacter sp. S45]
MTGFVFATGVENSAPIVAGGKRLDEYELCGHYARWREDFDAVQELGLGFLRYGPQLFSTFVGEGRYDWAFADETLNDLRRRGITPIADLCHFGVPDWIGDFQNPDFPRLFEGYARAFARRYPWVQMFTPVNEMYICAKFSALTGWWNERLTGDRSFVTALKHIVKANILAMQAILETRPDAMFVQSESSEHYHAALPGAQARAAFHNAHRYLSLDLNYGHPVDANMYEYLLDNGMTREEYGFFQHNTTRARCILGNDYYPSSEQWVFPDGRVEGGGEVLGYGEITRQYFNRYRIPVMHTETNVAQGPHGDEGVHWLRKEFANVLRVREVGVPIIGFTWYSITDQVDWDNMLREVRGTVNPLGLYDLDRNIRPVGRAYKELVAAWKDLTPVRSGVLTLPVTPLHS